VKNLCAILDMTVSKRGFASILIMLVLVGGTIGITVVQITSITDHGLLDSETRQLPYLRKMTYQ